MRGEFFDRVELGVEFLFHPIAFLKDGIRIVFKIFFFHLKFPYASP
jgi:hypothetical protein